MFDWKSRFSKTFKLRKTDPLAVHREGVFLLSRVAPVAHGEELSALLTVR